MMYIFIEFLIYALFATSMCLHIANLNDDGWNDSGANTILVVILFIFGFGAVKYMCAEIYIYR